jgi:hypothetical protein
MLASLVRTAALIYALIRLFSYAALNEMNTCLGGHLFSHFCLVFDDIILFIETLFRFLLISAYELFTNGRQTNACVTNIGAVKLES